MHVAEIPCRHTFGDQLLHPARGDTGVLLVDRACGGEGIEVDHELVRRGIQRGPDRGQVGGDAITRAPRARDPGFHEFRCRTEEVHGGRLHQLLLAAGQCVERRLRTPQSRGDVLEREVSEALGQQQVGERVEQLGTPPGGERGPGHGGNSTVYGPVVLFPVWLWTVCSPPTKHTS